MSNLLLVEDDALLAKGLKDHLEAAFPRSSVDCCRNREEALELLQRQAPSVVVMDCRMQGCDIALTLEEIKALSPMAKVIALGDNPAARFAEEHRQLVLFDFLEHPFAPEELAYVVGRALRSCGPSSSRAVSRGSKSSTSNEAPFCDRHKLLNVIGGVLAGLRAFEADLEAESEHPEEVRKMVEDYVPRLVGMLNEAAHIVKSARVETEDDRD